jgi:PAT family beta-lactamase induction signal transducer AmpG
MTLSTLSPFLNRRMLAIFALGFSSGLPLMLTIKTLQAWMKDAKIDLTTIGAMSLVGMPYVWKFVWSPLIDRFRPPFLGRRRGWILICQVLVMLSIVALGTWTPDMGAPTLALLAFLVAFFSATQDIVIDAYRTELLKPEEYGPGASTYTLGYRFGMILSISGALRLSEFISWRGVYWTMALFMLPCIIALLRAPEPEVEAKPPQTIEEAVTLPFYQFFRREGAVEMLAFTLLYKLDGVLVDTMTTPFFLELGFSKGVVGDVSGYQGLLATMAGLMLGGILMPRLGLYVSLWVFGLMQGVSNLAYWWLASSAPTYGKLILVIVLDNIATGMGVAALQAFMMSLCDARYTATQFALLSSFMAQTRVIGAAPSGWLANGLGWPLYFLFCTVIAVPGLLLLTRYKRWTSREAEVLDRPVVMD